MELMISITCVVSRFWARASGCSSAYLKASLVNVADKAAPMKKSPSIKYWRKGGRFSALATLWKG